jgi:hypothetical protein
MGHTLPYPTSRASAGTELKSTVSRLCSPRDGGHSLSCSRNGERTKSGVPHVVP